MAHHLIALLFSSAQHTTSPSMKPTHPVHHHTTETLFPYLSLLCSAFVYSCPTVTFFTFFIPPPSFLVTVASISLYSSLSLFLSSSLCLFGSFHCCSEAKSPTPHLSSLAGSLISADVPLVSGGLAGRQQK